MASSWYPLGKVKVLNGDTDLLTDNIKALLVSDAYAYNAAHEFVADVVASELAGTGYAGGFGGAGRKALAGKAVALVGALASFDADDLTWAGLDAGTVGGIIVFREATSDADSPLIAFLDPADLVSNGGNVVAAWHADGILQF